MRLSVWDRRLAARAAALAGVTALVALLVIATTDDGASWARRAAMWGAVAPVAGAIGALGAVRLAEARGEMLALCAIGVRPWRARMGAVLGGVALALAGPCVAGSRLADLSALFPRLIEERVWLPGEEEEGELGRSTRASMREVTMGIRVEPSGRVTFIEGAASGGAASGGEDAGFRLEGVGPSSLSRGSSAAAIGALVLSAIACPIWVVVRSTWMRKAAVALAALAALIAAFQAVAMGRGGPLMLLAAPLLLLADALVARYRARRHE